MSRTEGRCSFVSAQTDIVDEMCSQLPFIKATVGIGALMKSAVITLFLLQNDNLSANEKGELFEMASLSGSALYLPQRLPAYISTLNHNSPVKQLDKRRFTDKHGQFIPYFVRCASDALQGDLPPSVFPYVRSPPPGFEPFNSDARAQMLVPEELLRASVDPMLIIVIVGGLSFNELQAMEALVKRTRRPLLCIAMNMTTMASYMADLFATRDPTAV